MMKMARIVYRQLPPKSEYEDPTEEEIEEVRLARESLMRLLDDDLLKHNSMYDRLINRESVLDASAYDGWHLKGIKSSSASLDNPSYDWVNAAIGKDDAK